MTTPTTTRPVDALAVWVAAHPEPPRVIPAGRVLCDACDGDGDDAGTTGERCPRCHGFGHIADLDAIWQRTAAAALIDADRAAQS